MKKILALFSLLLCVAASAAAPDFYGGSLPPFSFKLDGMSSETFIRKWKKETVRTAPDSWTVTYTSPSRDLRIRSEIKNYPDFDATEWTLHVENLSDSDSPRITDLRAADFLLQTGSDVTLYTLEGSDARQSDFSLVKLPLAPGEAKRFAPTGGRSSAVSAFPFYNVAFGDTSGCFVAVGWTGGWEAEFLRTGKGVEVRAGMPVDLYLKPSESIRTPKILTMRWSGAKRIDGHNKFRRFMLAHCTPRGSDGRIIPPPFCAGFDYGDPSPCLEFEAFTEPMAKALIDRHRRWGIMPEHFWIDAGWYKGNNSPMDSKVSNWGNTVGTWEADSCRFPGGIKAVSDAAREAGAGLLLWFEFERVYKGTKWWREHPEWLLRREEWANNNIFDLGNPEACAFLIDYFLNFVEENGITCYRQDFNLSPDYIWEACDEPGRRGITEIRYIEGLYRFLDAIRERFPDLIIDNCASGGRRLDIEMMSRSIPLWRSDYNFGEPDGQQSHEYGISQFLPVQGISVIEPDDYSSRSGMSASCCWYGEVFRRGANAGDIKHFFDTYYRIRRIFLEDFYPLSGDGSTVGPDKWIAWQFNDPVRRKGIIEVFRRAEAGSCSETYRPEGLDPGTEYLFSYEHTSERFIMTGREAMEGITVNLPDKRSSALLEYCPAAEGGVKDAREYGFLPGNDPVRNSEALQKCLDGGGIIRVSDPGVYELCRTVLLDSDTEILFGDGVVLRRSRDAAGVAARHVFLNRGALTREYNDNITIRGLHLECAGIDEGSDIPEIVGLRGQVAMFYVRNLLIDGFTLPDLGKRNFAVQICTFKDAKVTNARIEGRKDGVHFGPGSGFEVSHCVFRTYDDPIALNAQDYTTGNPEMGWIQNGLVEDCWDLEERDSVSVGYFARIIAGAWKDWEEGMAIQSSGDAVISGNRIYRSNGPVDGPARKSVCKPVHEEGTVEYPDGIVWTMSQDRIEGYNCGVRNVTFRDIHLCKRRPTAFSFHYDHDKYSRSHYPGAIPPVQSGIVFDGCTVEAPIRNFIQARTPVGSITVRNSSLGSSVISFITLDESEVDYGTATVTLENNLYESPELVKCAPLRDVRTVHVR